MKSITIATIPHESQRYPTVGDWWDEDHVGEHWQIRVSRLGNWRHELLVGIHELIEMALCRQRGISEQEVTEFDQRFEAHRVPGQVGEPGDEPRAPYHREHRCSENIERLVAHELGVEWPEYEAAIERL